MDTPSYVTAHRKGMLRNRVRQAVALLKECTLCPRECGVDRLSDEKGYCRTGRAARVASFDAHFGEESPLVGRHGSGTIFISFCNLFCSFCQNFEISHRGEGREVKLEHFAVMMLQFEDGGEELGIRRRFPSD